MIAKTIEIRDDATFIPALAVKLQPTNEADRYLFGRAGYGLRPKEQAEYVVLHNLNGGIGPATCDPYEWNTRTMQIAHDWLIQNFDTIESGAVVDVEVIIGRRAEPKRSERFTSPL